MTDKTTTEDTRPLLELARARITGLAGAEAALAEVERRLTAAHATPRPEHDAADDALPDVLAGRGIPDDIGHRLLVIRQANEAAAASVLALQRLRDQLWQRQRDVQVTHADDALAVLRDELNTLLASARPLLARLGGVNDADDAIAADQVQPWRQAVAMAARYAELRQAQMVIVSAALEPAGTRDISPFTVDYGHVRDADRHDPDVGTDPYTPRVQESLMITHIPPTGGSNRPWCTGNTLADLRYVVCRDDVDPWLPSMRELTGARAAHRERKLDAARTAAGLPAAAAGQSMVDTSIYRPRSMHNVRSPDWAAPPPHH